METKTFQDYLVKVYGFKPGYKEPEWKAMLDLPVKESELLPIFSVVNPRGGCDLLLDMRFYNENPNRKLVSKHVSISVSSYGGGQGTLFSGYIYTLENLHNLMEMLNIPFKFSFDYEELKEKGILTFRTEEQFKGWLLKYIDRFDDIDKVTFEVIDNALDCILHGIPL